MNDNDTINCFTEHKVNGRIFRADCSYRGGEAWFDWVSVIWETDDERKIEVFAKIHICLLTADIKSMILPKI